MITELLCFSQLLKPSLYDRQLIYHSSFSLHSITMNRTCLLYTSDAADERSSVDLGGRRIIKKKKDEEYIRGLRPEYRQRSIKQNSRRYALTIDIQRRTPLIRRGD